MNLVLLGILIFCFCCFWFCIGWLVGKVISLRKELNAVSTKR